jgi:hypothetical protein
VLGGLAPIALTADYLTIGSYLGYFLPLHLLLVGVALRIRERGGSPPLRDVVARVGPFAVGAAVPLALVLIGYAFAGGLGDLLHGMFVLPGSLLGYAQPVHVPPVSRLWLLLALFGPSFAVGLFLRHHRAAAALAAIITGAALAVCAFAPPWSGLPDHALRRAGMAFAEIWSPALGAIGVITWWRVKPADDDPALLVLFFHLLLCFQFFPRAGVNVWLVLGATAPLLAWLGALARRRMLPEADTLGARVAVLAALAFPLVWIGLEPARHVIADPAGPGFVAVDLPSARGLAIPTGQAGRLPLVGLRDTVAHLLRVTAPDAPILVVGNEILPLYLADRPALAPDLQLRVFLLAWGMLEGTGGIDEDGLIDALHADPRARVLEMDGPSSERVRTALPGLARALDAFDEEARYGPFRVLRAPSPAT